MVVIVSYAFYIRAYIRRYYYDGNDQFLTIKKGVFAPTEIHMQYQKIQDVYVDQDLLDRMMGLYDVHIASATVTSGIEARIDGVDVHGAEGLKNFLLGRIGQGSRRGGTATGDQSATPHAGMPNVPIRTSFTERISSETYPLGSSWFVVELLSGSIKHLLTLCVAVFLIFGKIFAGRADTAQNLFGDYSIWYWVLGLIVFYVLVWGPIYLTLWRKNFKFDFGEEYILMKTGIISKEEKHVPYATVQDVVVSQGIIERMFGLAHIVIQNAAQGGFAAGGRGSAVPVFGGIIIPGQRLERAQHISEMVKSVVLSHTTAGTGL